jgi:hypothetical protein
VRYTKRMENAVLPYEHTYIPVVVYAIPLIILIIWLLCIFIGLRLAARIIKINSEKTSRSQAGDQPQVLVESEQKRIYSQITFPKDKKKRPTQLIGLVLGVYAFFVCQIHAVRITDKMFECHYLISNQNIEIPISRITKTYFTMGLRIIPMLRIQTTDGKLIRIETDDAGRIQSILESINFSLSR